MTLTLTSLTTAIMTGRFSQDPNSMRVLGSRHTSDRPGTSLSTVYGLSLGVRVHGFGFRVPGLQRTTLTSEVAVGAAGRPVYTSCFM